MPVNKNLIYKKIDFLNKNLSAIERMEFDEQTFVDNEDIHDLVTFRLQQAVETCIDIANHLINSLELNRKETAKDALETLGQKGLINKTLAVKMGDATNFRNRVVHGYDDFDYRLLFKDYKEDLKDLRLFAKEILDFIEKN